MEILTTLSPLFIAFLCINKHKNSISIECSRLALINKSELILLFIKKLTYFYVCPLIKVGLFLQLPISHDVIS